MSELGNKLDRLFSAASFAEEGEFEAGTFRNAAPPGESRWEKVS